MFNFYDKFRYQKYGLMSSVMRFGFRLLLGLVVVYVGVDLAKDIVRSDHGSNQQIKSMIDRYDVIEVFNAVVSDVSGAFEDGFGSGNSIQSSNQLNDQAKTTATSLSARFKVHMPKLHSAVDDVLSSVIGSFQEAIRTGTK